MNNQFDYIFAEELNQDSINVWSFIDGSWRSQSCSMEELKLRRIVLILPVKNCSIFQLDLPKLSHRDIPKVIVSLLEEQVFQDFSELWWTYEKVGQKYNVYLWDKTYTDNLRSFCQEKGFLPQAHTMDWFALNEKEVWLNHDGAFVHVDDIKGFLPGVLLSNWLKKHLLDYHYFTSSPREDIPNALVTSCSWQQWVLERLHQKPFRDVFEKPNKWDINQYLSKESLLQLTRNIVIAFSSLMVLASIGLFGYQSVLIYQNKQEMKQFSDIPNEYLEQKLRIYQHQQSEKNKFWLLWIGLQKSLNNSIEIKNIVYEKNKMKVSIVGANLQGLQELKTSLIRRHIRVEQSQVQTSTSGIKAVLDLQGG